MMRIRMIARSWTFESRRVSGTLCFEGSDGSVMNNVMCMGVRARGFCFNVLIIGMKWACLHVFL